MKALLQQSFNGHSVRVFGTPETPLFVAADVCRILELSDVTSALRGLDDDEKGPLNVRTPGGEQAMNAVTQSGLYALIFKSRKPEAKAFRKWVTSEVLPAIRKTGAYAVQQELPGIADPLNEIVSGVKRLRKVGISPDVAAQIVADMLKPVVHATPAPPEPSKTNQSIEPSKATGVPDRILELIPDEGINRTDLVKLWIKQTGGAHCTIYFGIQRLQIAGLIEIEPVRRNPRIFRKEVAE